MQLIQKTEDPLKKGPDQPAEKGEKKKGNQENLSINKWINTEIPPNQWMLTTTSTCTMKNQNHQPNINKLVLTEKENGGTIKKRKTEIKEDLPNQEADQLIGAIEIIPEEGHILVTDITEEDLQAITDHPPETETTRIMTEKGETDPQVETDLQATIDLTTMDQTEAPEILADPETQALTENSTEISLETTSNKSLKTAQEWCSKTTTMSNAKIQDALQCTQKISNANTTPLPMIL